MSQQKLTMYIDTVSGPLSGVSLISTNKKKIYAVTTALVLTVKLANLNADVM